MLPKTPPSCHPDDLTQRHLNSLGFNHVAGVDEAGRGPLAGPVVAAAIILPQNLQLPGLNDSKKVSVATRDRLFEQITSHPDVIWAVAEASVAEIDSINILRATHLAMRRALESLPHPADHALIDGSPVPGLNIPHTNVIKGDSTCRCIAAASILAKTTRDRLMQLAHHQFPEYQFSKHKGYGTALHLQMLQSHGPSPLHRLTFAPVAHAAHHSGSQRQRPTPRPRPSR